MWTTVFKSVVEAVLPVLSQTQQISTTSTENHRGAGNSNGNPSYRPPPRSVDPNNPFANNLTNHSDDRHQQRNFQQVPSNPQRNSYTSYNGGNDFSNNNTAKQNNPKGKFVVVDKPKTGNTNKPKNNDNTFCMVKMPSQGNFKIHIEKTGSDSSRMNSNSANKKFNNGSNDNRQQENKSRQFKNQNSNRKNNSRMPDNSQNSQQFGNLNNRQNTWMYIGKLKIGTTESDLSSYLRIKFPKNQFIIHSLPLYKNGKLPCFKVNVDNAILNEFQLLANWPAGVTIKKYQHNFGA